MVATKKKKKKKVGTTAKPENPGKPDKVKKPKKPKKPKTPKDPSEPVDPTLPVEPTDPVEEVPTSFDELEKMLGDEPKAHRLEFNDIDDLTPELDEDGNLPKPPPQLDMNEIAEIAHNAVTGYRAIMFPEKFHPIYSQLSSEHKEILKNDVQEILMSASNPDDIAVARLKHAQRAMSLLTDGAKFGLEETAETTILVMPWEYLPNEHRMPLILFRNIAKALLTSVWIGH